MGFNEQFVQIKLSSHILTKYKKLGSLLSYLDDLKASCKMLHTDNVSNEKIKLFEPKWFIGKY